MLMLYNNDIDIAPILARKVAVIGYGSQGRAQALNLRDSGVDVTVGLRPKSPGREQAAADGVAVADVVEAVAAADVVAMLIPDEAQPAVYRSIEPSLREGATLVFAHGFNIHYGRIEPRADLDVVMAAPFGIGEKVRSLYEAGGGTAGMVAVDADASGHALSIALGFAKALGLGHGGVIETTFKEETETDLFAEQAVLCGGLTHLITAAYETLVGAGYAPEIAYFSCLHEVKLMADVIHTEGIARMRESISSTAAFGDATRGPRVINEQSRREMAAMLDEIRDGRFAEEQAREMAAGGPVLAEYRREAAGHSIEKVGRPLREAMKNED
ncbi:MAG TPA: ketol-acid reductoisomerase [Gammaproteobacteria bacterium]|nr:ketol-acid reductoisomerase [Gammaproteobacteria bacterium]